MGAAFRGWEIEDQRAVAAYAGLDERYISRILPCAFLAPTFVEAILEGRQPADLSLEKLLQKLPRSWKQQLSSYISRSRFNIQITPTHPDKE